MPAGLFPPLQKNTVGTEDVNPLSGRMGAMQGRTGNPGVVRRHGRGTRQPTLASATSTEGTGTESLSAAATESEGTTPLSATSTESEGTAPLSAAATESEGTESLPAAVKNPQEPLLFRLQQNPAETAFLPAITSGKTTYRA